MKNTFLKRQEEAQQPTVGLISVIYSKLIFGFAEKRGSSLKVAIWKRDEFWKVALIRRFDLISTVAGNLFLILFPAWCGGIAIWIFQDEIR